jgi:hypothetical protein
MQFIIAFLFLILVLVFQIWKSHTVVKLFSLILGGFIFFLVLYNVTYNNDWDAYKAVFNGEIRSNDYLFNIISNTAAERGYDYESVYKFHIFLIGIFFFYFVSRSSYANIFAIITIYLLFQIVPVSNQIRYYLAFSFFLFAAYIQIIRRNHIVFVLFSLLSVLSHFGILLMFPFFYFYNKMNSSEFPPRLFLFGFIFGFFIFLIVSTDYALSTTYSSYLDFNSLSSLSGGLLNNSIWALWLLFIFHTNRRLEKHRCRELLRDEKYQFFYKLSFYCILFYPASFVIQILAHRYLASTILVWLTFYFYSLNYEVTKKSKLFSFLVFFSLISFTFFYVYYLPTILLGLSTTGALLLIFTSNEYFNGILWIN